MDFSGLAPADILLPTPGVDLEKWAVVACDQYTADPAYWQRVEQHVGDAPSTLRLIYPEIYLEQGLGRIPEIQGAMRRYLREGVLCCAHCLEEAGEGQARALDRGSLAAMRHIVYGDPKRLFSFQVDREGQDRLSAACEDFLREQLDRGFRTLDFYHQLRGAALPPER